ncbi:MAG: 3-methyl-2-oxobutanoate hydroxymethyltransferase [Candidatus Baltobacteraceae bacterium]
MRRITAGAIKRRKGKAVFPMVTAYDAAFARIVEDAGIDYILVGDSLGNVVLGYDETTPVTMDEMIHHAKAVVRATLKAHIVVDMPFGSYHISDEDALRNAIRIVKETGASSVKVEGGVHEADRVRAIARSGIPVVGHIGVTPQTASLGPGYKRRANRERLLADAQAIEAAGAYAIVLEVIDDAVAAEITGTLSIPTIGIGAGPHCDSQVLVIYDLLGMYPHAPSFVKRYGELGQAAYDALRAFAADVREKRFP